MIDIQLGDCQVLGESVCADSVDLIITDPLYAREALPLYGWLGRFAARVLKPGAYLFAYGATMFQREVMTELDASGLTYFWQDIILHSGSQPRIWSLKLMSSYKPVFIYTKGEPSIRPWRATAHNCKQDKRYHRYGQGMEFPIKLIEMYTQPGALICDPFSGGGTVAAVCKLTHRNFVGFEKDATAHQACLTRLAYMPEGLDIM